MSDLTHNSYSLYKRETGTRTIWYARFWNDETQSYGSGRSTGQTTKSAGHRQVQKWMAEGLPQAQKKDFKATKNRIVGAITKYLLDCEVIKKGEMHEDSEIVKLFYTQVTNTQMASGEKFVDYLYRFWAWDSDYVQGRLERGKHIGKRYVDGCHTKIRVHIEPFFKEILLCDITTLLLEQFMRSFPRRDVDPKNGYSKSTINLVMKVIKKALKEAVRLGIIPRNPADSIELLSEDTQERGILTPLEAQNLFALAWTDERSKTAAILAAVSGMRLGEIVGLRIENINAEKNVIVVEHSYSYYEKRLKGTKTEKPRMVFTDSSIIKMLINLHAKNPYQASYIFWGLEPNKPMRYDTVEEHLEKMLALLFGETVKRVVDKEWRELAQIIATQVDIPHDAMIGIQSENLDTEQNCIELSCYYSFGARKIEACNYPEKKIIPIKTSTVKKFSAIFGKNSGVFIARGADRENPIDFETLTPKDASKLTLAYGEITRKERNITFHGFRHFFNSTIRGTVSDDILRLQTGHLTEEMTDRYDHATEEKGEQLRKAVQTKILPFMPNNE